MKIGITLVIKHIEFKTRGHITIVGGRMAAKRQLRLASAQQRIVVGGVVIISNRRGLKAGTIRHFAVIIDSIKPNLST